MCLAVSIELKNYYPDPKRDISRLPVFIDATCNGLQHLSAMINDISVAKRVNIHKSSDSDIPEDIYELRLDKINLELKENINKLCPQL